MTNLNKTGQRLALAGALLLAAPLLIAAMPPLLRLPETAATAPAVLALPDLRTCASFELQRGLERVVADAGLGDEVRSGHLSLSLVDITNGAVPRLAMLNGDSMQYAASLPKIAILLGAFVQAERGLLSLDSAHMKVITQMIRVSSNEAANQVLAWVGPQNLPGILQSPAFRLYDAQRDGGLWVGKGYGGEGAFARDPLKNLSHGATAFQVARFYWLLDNNRLVNPDLTAQMKQTMSEPGIHHKFVKGLDPIPGLKLLRKSGTWRDTHADSVLVESGDRRYIMVGLAQHPQGGDWLVRLAPRLHALIEASPEPQLAVAAATR